MTYLVAILGVFIFVPYPVIGSLMFAGAAVAHQSGWVTPSHNDTAQVILFYAALAGVLTAILV